MDWIMTIIKANTAEDGTINEPNLRKQLKEDAPKYIVPKDQYNAQAEKLMAAEGKVTDAEATITTLKADNTGNEKLQKQINDWKAKAEAADEQVKLITVKHEAEAALKAAGVKDTEYGLFKLGELELDKDGKVKDLTVRVKSLKEASPAMFEAEAAAEDDGGESDDGKAGKSGYAPLDNGLKPGDKGSDKNAALLSQIEASLGLAPIPTT